MTAGLPDAPEFPSRPAGGSRPVAEEPAGRRGGFVAALALLVPIIVVYLWYPQNVDGILFENGARRMGAGAVYYRDLWDIKQPGIYWIYQVGLQLGLGVVGPRLIEIGGMVGGGAAVWYLSGAWRLRPVVRLVSPALVLGSYLLMTHWEGVLLVEGLVNPLLVLVLALTWPRNPSGGPARAVVAWGLAGVVIGVVGLLKLLYVPLPATVLLGALLVSRTSAAGRVVRVLAAAVGAAMPLAIAVAYFWRYDALALAWTTTVTVPLESLSVPAMESGYVRWLEVLAEMSPLLVPPALVALWTSRRRGTLVRDLTLVAVIAEGTALAFKQYATPYRPLVLVAPLGLLAIVGADVIWRRARAAADPRRATATVLAIALVAALPLARGTQRLVFAVPRIESWGLGEQARNQRDAALGHLPYTEDAEPARSLVRPGDAIYVLGPPQIYQYLHAREAVEITGWAAVLMPDRVWRERDRELVRSKPRLMFLWNSDEQLIREHSPGLSAMLDHSYRVVATTPTGTWYLTDSPGTPSGVPGDNRLVTT